MSNLEFRNINFVREGNLMNLQHLLPNPVMIQNSAFENITSGFVHVQSSSTSDDGLTSQVSIDNMTLSDSNMVYGSFLNFLEGAEVDITNSVFSNTS